MPLTLLLARHGETDLNREDRWQGRIDAPLNAAGQAQAQRLADQLPPGIEAIVASPLQRARQTAEPAALRLGLPIAFEDDFRERDFGVFDGLTEAEAAAQFPELAARNAAYRWDLEPPGAEPTRAVVERVARGAWPGAPANAARGPDRAAGLARLRGALPAPPARRRARGRLLRRRPPGQRRLPDPHALIQIERGSTSTAKRISPRAPGTLRPSSSKGCQAARKRCRAPREALSTSSCARSTFATRWIDSGTAG